MDTFELFSKLAPELRLNLLEAALITMNHIVDFQIQASGINPAMLLTSKWVHDEGLRILLSENVFHFTHVDVFLQHIKSRKWLLDYVFEVNMRGTHNDPFR